jgi:hypothetical protein
MGQVLFNHFNPTGFENYIPDVSTKSKDLIVEIILVTSAIAVTIYILNRINVNPEVRIAKQAYKE